MSIPAYRAVWQMNEGAAQPLRGSVLAVWLCLAEHANAGGYCFPSIPRIARFCGIDDRSVQRALRVLELRDVVRIKEGLPGKRNAYYVPVIADETGTGDE